MKNSISQIKTPKTKIICTLGPSTHTKSVITKLIKSGMSIARLNMSHGSLESHESLIQNIRQISSDLDTPIGIMIDIPGTKYRISKLENKEYDLIKGENITITTKKILGNSQIINVEPNGIHNDIKLNSNIFIDDGLIKLRAIKVNEKEIVCKILNNGKISLKKDGEVKDAKSVMEVLMLGATEGNTLKVTATGEGEEDALKAISDLFAARFNELE